MITFLLATIATVLALQLIVMLVVIVAIHHDTAQTSNLHTTVDDIRTDLQGDRNRAVRWQG